MHVTHSPAAAGAAAGPSPAEDGDAPQAVQAGAAAALLGMAAWRLEEALAVEDEAARALVRCLRVRLAAPELAPAKAALRRLLLLLKPSAMPGAREGAHAASETSVADPKAKDDDDIALVRLLIERSKEMLAAEPLERGGWAVLRWLAGTRGRQASVADLSILHGVPAALVLSALRRLEVEGCVALELPAGGAGDGSIVARLTDHGASQAQADTLPDLARLLEEGFDADGLWALLQLGSTLLQVDEVGRTAAPAA